MWVRSSAPLSGHIIQLSTPVSSHFLILGQSSALVDGSIASMAIRLTEQIGPYHKGDFPLSHLLLTHAHFDHVGGVPLLRQQFPELQLIASPQTAEILSAEDRVREIYDRNRVCADVLNHELEMDFETFKSLCTVSRIVSEGDTLSLGEGVEVKVVACPGHTADCTGYFVKAASAFAGAESVGGFSGREKITPCFLSSREDYIRTLEKIQALDIRYLSLPHGGALTGDLVKRFLTSARDEAERFVNEIKAAVAEGAIPEELYLDLVGEWTVQGISPDGPFLPSQEETARKMMELALGEVEVDTTPKPLGE